MPRPVRARRDDQRWKIDEFAGALAGLVLCEIEDEDEDEATPFDRPEWLGREVTGDPAYYNAQLARAGA